MNSLTQTVWAPQLVEVWGCRKLFGRRRHTGWRVGGLDVVVEGGGRSVVGLCDVTDSMVAAVDEQDVNPSRGCMRRCGRRFVASAWDLPVASER